MNECNRWHFAHVGAPWKYSKCSRQSWYDMTWWTLHKCVAKELLVMAWALPPQTRFNDESLASELFKFLWDTVWLSRWCFTDLVEEACGNVSVSRLWCWSVKVQPGANHAVWWYTSILCIHASTITPQVALWCLSLHLLEKWPQIWVLVLAWESASGNCILQVTSKSPKSLLSMPLIASADKPVKLTTSWYAKAGSQVRLFKWQLQTSECNRLYCAHAGDSCRWVKGSLGSSSGNCAATQGRRICRCLLWCSHHHCACDVSTFDLMADNARMIILDTKFGNYRWFGNFWLGICFCWRTGRKPLLSNWHHALAYMWPVTCYNLLQNAFAG